MAHWKFALIKIRTVVEDMRTSKPITATVDAIEMCESDQREFEKLMLVLLEEMVRIQLDVIEGENNEQSNESAVCGDISL